VTLKYRYSGCRGEEGNMAVLPENKSFLQTSYRFLRMTYDVKHKLTNTWGEERKCHLTLINYIYITLMGWSLNEIYYIDSSVI
jgi:hypothetical protein